LVVDGDLSDDFLGDTGDCAGEWALSSEKVVVDEAGEVLPPQPKKEPSFDVPGDLGSALFELLKVPFPSEKSLDTTLSGSFRCGGVGLVEKTDIVAGDASLEVYSSYHGPVGADAELWALSLVKLS
jgi:hypothetical protein